MTMMDHAGTASCVNLCPDPDASVDRQIYAPLFGVMGVVAAAVFTAFGAAYGTAKSGTGIAAMSVMRPELIMKSIIPVVMAGIIAIYGLVVAVLIASNLNNTDYDLYKAVCLKNNTRNIVLSTFTVYKRKQKELLNEQFITTEAATENCFAKLRGVARKQSKI